MGKVVAFKLGVKHSKRSGITKNKASGGNRHERKLKNGMKEWRQAISMANNELHRSKKRRKATRKEKEILKQLETKMDREERSTLMNLRIAKKQ